MFPNMFGIIDKESSVTILIIKEKRLSLIAEGGYDKVGQTTLWRRIEEGHSDLVHLLSSWMRKDVKR